MTESVRGRIARLISLHETSESCPASNDSRECRCVVIEQPSIEEVAAKIRRHATMIRDGLWVRCSCDGKWRGLEEWSLHVATETVEN